jgi:hypothetical protein
MGSGIATALILSNIYVVLKEVNSEYLLKGIRFIEGFFFFFFPTKVEIHNVIFSFSMLLIRKDKVQTILIEAVRYCLNMVTLKL